MIALQPYLACWYPVWLRWSPLAVCGRLADSLRTGVDHLYRPLWTLCSSLTSVCPTPDGPRRRLWAVQEYRPGLEPPRGPPVSNPPPARLAVLLDTLDGMLLDVLSRR